MGAQSEWSYLRRVYDGAKERCNNPNHISFQYYGARGINFNFNSFTDFCKELGHRPEGCTLDRIDPNGHYEVGNVRWATPKEQRNNQRPIPKGSSGYLGVSIRNPTKSHPYNRYLVRVTVNNRRKLLYIGKDLDKAILIAKERYAKKESN